MLNIINQIIKIKYKFIYIYISFFLLFISLFSFLFIYQSTKNENIELIVIDGGNSIAPSFTSTTLAGDKYILDFNNQKPTIITFWASWCPPCREELPILENIHKENKNIRILGVNINYEFDVVITEVGGTVGDIEGQPFYEAIRQLRLNIGRKNTMVIHHFNHVCLGKKVPFCE